MRSCRPILTAVVLTTTMGAAAMAAHVDFNDPRRALGRQDDIRVDAELGQDTVAANAPITVTYQIAIADKVSDASFDASRSGPNMPHLVLINLGEKHVLTAGALLHILLPNVHARFMPVPRYVQIKVTVLRDVTPFAKLVERQTQSATPVGLPSDMFDRWVDNSASIFLNTIPVSGTRRVLPV